MSATQVDLLNLTCQLCDNPISKCSCELGKVSFILHFIPERINRVKVNGHLVSLSKSLEIVNHSPTGFAWGYGGSGPAQLALAILIEIFPVDFALEFYQQFKWEVISKIPQNSRPVAAGVTIRYNMAENKFQPFLYLLK